MFSSVEDKFSDFHFVNTTEPFIAIIHISMMYHNSVPHINRIKTKTSDDSGYNTKTMSNSSIIYIICDTLPTGLRKSDLEIRINEQIVQCNDIYGNYAIKCETTLMDPRNDDITEVSFVNRIYIRVLTTGYESNHIEHVLRSETRGKKRQGTCDNVNQVDISSIRPLKSRIKLERFSLLTSIRIAKSIITHQSYDEKTKWRKLARLVYDYSWENNSKVTFFHDALVSKDIAILNIFNELLQSSSHRYYLSTVKTRHGETLLNYACKMNKPEFVRQLVKVPSLLYKQDNLGNTPLHNAINKRHEHCIAEFLKILQPTEINDNIICEALIRMIKCYNQANYQVVHASIMAGNVPLTMVLLDFCQYKDIDITSLRVLGSNQSIFDLVIKAQNMY